MVIASGDHPTTGHGWQPQESTLYPFTPDTDLGQRPEGDPWFRKRTAESLLAEADVCSCPSEFVLKRSECDCPGERPCREVNRRSPAWARCDLCPYKGFGQRHRGTIEGEAGRGQLCASQGRRPGEKCALSIPLRPPASKAVGGWAPTL